uniref:Alsin Rho guanine nucleotide exchange factor ALS2 a n=1 Tax=Kryptolebias marmoratus TaxID=37003 RepID=A0A3Q2ZTX7_KRYMA
SSVCRPADERAVSAPERGLLHVWCSAGCSPERALLSTPALQVALGEHHGLVLAQGGQVFSFGALSWRNLSIPVSAPVLELALRGKTIVRVAAGGFHCGAISEHGNVYMWGENTAGQCGGSERVSEPSPVSVVDSEGIPPAAVRVVDLACGREHSLALSAQNELWAWGSGCQLVLGCLVACGAYHSLALVLSLPAQGCNAQSSPKTKERAPPPHCLVVDRDELFAADDSHYCPLGVELTEAMRSEVNNPLFVCRKVLSEEMMIKRLQESLAAWKHNLKKGGMVQGSTAQFYSHGARLVIGGFDLLSCSVGGLAAWRSSSPVCLEEVRLCLEKERLSLQGQKSSSLTNIHQRWKTAAGRRRSLPGTPTHGRNGRVPFSVGPEEAGDGLPSLETEVWSWGRGSEGQLGHGDQLARLQPLCIKTLTGQEVIKVSAGSHHSLALTAQCQVYSWGSNMCGQLGHINSPVTVPQQAKVRSSLTSFSKRCVHLVNDRVLSTDSTGGVHPEEETSSDSMGYISSVCSGGQMCASLTDLNVKGFIAAIHELASSERQFYCWLSSFRRILLTPLQSVCLALGEPCTQLFFSLWESFVHLSSLVGRHATSLSYFLHDAQGRDENRLLVVVIGPNVIQTLSFFSLTNSKRINPLRHTQMMFKGVISVSLGSQQTLLSQLNVPDPSVSGDGDLVSMFYWPLQQLHQYNRVLLKLTIRLLCCYQTLHHSFSLYETLSLSLLRKKKEAENTFIFWKSHSGKYTESLRVPHRRVVCESSNRSLTLQNAGRFSSHWFILFSDVLVHTQVHTHTQQASSHLFAGNINFRGITTDKIFTLVASTPQEKNKWLRALNQAVDQVLGGGGQGSSPGVAAMSRTATYTFTADERFRDAQYSGGWLAGRVHGRGTMKWPDGRMYKGNFKNGLEDGYGECVMPHKVQDKPDTYQGQWREGRIHGFGKYKYASGEVYEGCFCNGQRHGYGMLSSGKLDRSSSSVFIGHWVHDKKAAYGVYDDITRGEKYIGMWLDDQRHGSAVVVTQYGVYYEGTFRDNKMAGPGLLVSEDDTVFHGEFSDDWTVSGKGNP